MHTVSPHPALSVSLYVAKKKVLLVGEGDLADERLARLAAAGADVEQISSADFRSERAAGAFAIFAVTGDRDLDANIAAAARAEGALVYAHDLPDSSDFAMPALVRRGPLKLAISTDGTAPALARRLRELLDAAIAHAGAALDDLMDELGRQRRALPRGQRAGLYQIARRLRLRGRFEVDDTGA